MSVSQDVRACPRCAKDNAGDAAYCEGCGEDLAPAAPRRTAIDLPRATGGITSPQVLVGIALGAFIGFLLRPSIPFFGQLPLGSMFQLVTTGGDGFDQLFVPLAQRSFIYMAIGGMAGGFLGWLATQITPAPPSAPSAAASESLRACPFCAEMIQAQARICRYCNRPVEAG